MNAEQPQGKYGVADWYVMGKGENCKILKKILKISKLTKQTKAHIGYTYM